MGVVEEAVNTVSDWTQEIVEEHPIIGQPAAELIEEVSKPVSELGQEIDKPFIELYGELGLLPEVPQQELPEFDFGDSGDQPLPASSRQFKEPDRTGQRSNRRRNQQQGTALGSVLLAPDVLGNKSAVLGQNQGNLG